MKTDFINYVIVAAFATVGIEEFIKNFFKPQNTVWYALIMPPIALICFMAAYFLPPWVIGSFLTLSCVQVCYQTLIQGFQAIIRNIASKSKLIQDTISGDNND